MEAHDQIFVKETEQKTHFVLVHGLGGGSWCWYKIMCLMENSGFKVTCIDLKSSGVDLTPPDSILSFHDYNKPLLDFMFSLPDTEKVILVGHSAGGLNITQATYKFPEKIRLVVYVAATMLKSGFLTDQDLNDGVPDLSEYGDVNELGFGLGIDKPPTSALVKKNLQRKILYHMSPQEDSTLAGLLLRPGPIQALMNAKFPAEDDKDMDDVPRVYIKTTYDRVLKLEQQDAMVKKWTPAKVYVLDSDHSPFFSNPFVLFGLLVKAAISVGS